MGIKTMREKANITQSALALKMGITQSAIAQWETGESLPRAELLPKLAKALGCSIDDLFKRKEG